MSSTPPDLGSPQLRRRALLRSFFDAAVAAVHPAVMLPAALPKPPTNGRVVLFSTGKAGGSMMAAAADHYAQVHGLALDRLIGLGTARHGYEGEGKRIKVMSAGHPVPDQGSLDAAAATLALAEETRPEDLAVVLMSGGGSANWVLPTGGISLAEKQAINKALLRSGAHIGEMNAVRKHLSRIKGGRLAQKMGAGRIVTLAISDVPGDDPSTIASGPTVPDPTTLEDARAIVQRFGLSLPPAAVAALADPTKETPKPGDPLFRRTAFEIVARPRDGLAAALAAVASAGYEVISLGADVEGEARVVAADHATMARDLLRAGRRAAIVSGGELTVTIRGEGRGGPNQEYALALAIALDGLSGVAALAADTDGTDGGRGEPTDPAGAFIDETTLARADAMGLDASRHLADNDATPFFEGLGDLLSTGPTLTNANDLRILLIDP